MAETKKPEVKESSKKFDLYQNGRIYKESLTLDEAEKEEKKLLDRLKEINIPGSTELRERK